MKHRGLYDRDNRQRSENLMIQVNLWARLRRMDRE